MQSLVGPDRHVITQHAEAVGSNSVLVFDCPEADEDAAWGAGGGEGGEAAGEGDREGAGEERGGGGERAQGERAQDDDVEGVAKLNFDTIHDHLALRMTPDDLPRKIDDEDEEISEASDDEDEEISDAFEEEDEEISDASDDEFVVHGAGDEGAEDSAGGSSKDAAGGCSEDADDGSGGGTFFPMNKSLRDYLMMTDPALPHNFVRLPIMRCLPNGRFTFKTAVRSHLFFQTVITISR